MRIPFHTENIPCLAVAPADSSPPQTLVSPPTIAGDTVPRSCGDCHACCIHLPISAGETCIGEKPAGMVCPHLAAGGCRIYSVRPATCRQFRCVWLAEPSWPLAWRPDQCGLLCLREEVHEGVAAALVYEIQADAVARPTTESILASLQDSTAVVALVNLHQQRHLLRGSQWVENGEYAIRRPHFLRRIHAVENLQPSETRAEAR